MGVRRIVFWVGKLYSSKCQLPGKASALSCPLVRTPMIVQNLIWAEMRIQTLLYGDQICRAGLRLSYGLGIFYNCGAKRFLTEFTQFHVFRLLFPHFSITFSFNIYE